MSISVNIKDSCFASKNLYYIIRWLWFLKISGFRKTQNDPGEIPYYIFIVLKKKTQFKRQAYIYLSNMLSDSIDSCLRCEKYQEMWINLKIIETLTDASLYGEKWWEPSLTKVRKKKKKVLDDDSLLMVTTCFNLFKVCCSRALLV